MDDKHFDVMLLGTRTSTTGAGKALYDVDLSMAGVAPFSVRVKPDLYVRLAALPMGTALQLPYTVGVYPREISYGDGKKFTINELGIRTREPVVPTTAPEVARK
jgi:hypothetical protein